jgi:predicted metal-binding protein
MSGRIFVCITCNRYAPPSSPTDPTPGRQLAEAMIEIEGGCNRRIAVRTVQCLNGCPKPCTAALREPGKFVIRFSTLTASNANALLKAAELYAASADGNVPIEAFAAEIQGKVSAVIPSFSKGVPGTPHHAVHDPIPALPGFGP